MCSEYERVYANFSVVLLVAKLCELIACFGGTTCDVASVVTPFKLNKKR